MSDVQQFLDDLARRRADRHREQLAALEAAVGRHVRVLPRPADTAGPTDPRIIAAPAVPHAALERLTRHVWDLAFHGAPWPAGWRVRWARLAADRALALCAYQTKLLLFDEAALGPDGRYTRRDPHALLRVAVHELSHILHCGPDAHGPGFQRTWRLALSHVLGDADPYGVCGPTPAAGSR